MVWINRGYTNGTTVGGYGTIHKIVDTITGEAYQEKEITTGCGDRNTKVKILVNLMYFGSHPYEIDDCMDELTDPIIESMDPHKVVKMSYDKMELEYDKKISRMNKKLDILYKYSLSRENKIDIIIN